MLTFGWLVAESRGIVGCSVCFSFFLLQLLRWSMSVLFLFLHKVSSPSQRWVPGFSTVSHPWQVPLHIPSVLWINFLFSLVCFLTIFLQKCCNICHMPIKNIFHLLKHVCLVSLLRQPSLVYCRSALQYCRCFVLRSAVSLGHLFEVIT